MAIRSDPRIEPHIDDVFWIAWPPLASGDRETWLVGDRTWHGWPDPPEFAIWGLQGAPGLAALRAAPIVFAADFDIWPAAWVRDDFAPPVCPDLTAEERDAAANNAARRLAAVFRNRPVSG